MKRILTSVVLLSSIVFLSGCLHTFYPFFKISDLTFRPELIGDWSFVHKDEKGYVSFETISSDRRMELSEGIRPYADKAYLASWKNAKGEITSQYFVFPAKIGKYYYLDFYPAETAWEKRVDLIFRQQYVKLHLCYKLEVTNWNSFTIKLFDNSFANDLIKQNRLRLKYEGNEKDYDRGIISASTEELQEYLIRFSDNPNACKEIYYCTRIINYY